MNFVGFIIPWVGLYRIFENAPVVKYILDIATDTVGAILTARALMTAGDTAHLVMVPYNHGNVATIVDLINFEYAYYVTYSIVEMMNRDYSRILHHACTVIIIYLAQFYHAYQMLCFSLALFNASTIFLDVARFAKYCRWHSLQSVAFTTFSLTFFVCRIGGVPWIMYHVFMDVRPGLIITHGSWIVANLMLMILYSMQLMWFYRIIGIWRKMLAQNRN